MSSERMADECLFIWLRRDPDPLAAEGREAQHRREWQVERVVDKRGNAKTNRAEYLIKWLDHPDSQNL